MNKYRITLNDEQVNAVMEALNLRFRIDLCQDSDLSEILAHKNIDLNPELPEHQRIFDRYIERRNIISNIIKAIFDMTKVYWEDNNRNQRAMQCEDIWQVLRYQLYLDSPYKKELEGTTMSYKPMRISDQELPVIEKVDGD